MSALNLFSLTAFLRLDKSDYDKGLKESESTFSKFGKSLGNAVKNAAKISAAAVGAGAVAVGKIVKDAVKAYSEYEQLVGGVETLFGAGGKSLEEYAASVGKSVDEAEGEYKRLIRAQGKVLDNSKQAFKTAGMSANDYMAVATSFSASLIQSLGGDTKKAAELTDQAIIDMSDNANKMGTDIESIKTAYAGFAKQNYTMLDNLKLGYGGTKQEMERLIKDANRLRKAQGKNANLTIDSYADVIEAIHTVQDEMGITGTTAKEAESTIQGSLQMTKAAWQNVLVALSGGNIDLKKSINDLVKSAVNTFKNIMPVIMNVLDGFGEVVQQIAPVIAENLPKLVQEVLPKLLDAAVKLVGGLVAALPGILQAVQKAVSTALVNLVDFLNGNGLEWLGDFVTAVGGLFGGISDLLSGDVQGAIDGFAIFVGKIIQGILQLFGVDAESAKKILFSVIDWTKNAFNSVIDFFKDVFSGNWASVWLKIKTLFKNIWNGISTFFSGLFSKAVKLIKEINWEKLGTDIWNWIKSAFSGIYKWATNTFKDAVTAIKNIKWADVGKVIWNWIVGAFSGIVKWASDTWTNAANAIKKIKWSDVGQWIWDTIAAAFDSVVKFFTDLFSLDKEGGVGYEIENSIDWAGLGSAILDFITSAFDAIGEVFLTIFQNAWNAICDIPWDKVGTAIWDAIKKALKGIGDWLVGLFKNPLETIVDMINKVLRKIEQVEKKQGVTKGIASKVLGGSSTGSGKIRAFASGGVMGEGDRAIVGELRPEMLSVVNGHALVTPIGGIQPGDRLGGGRTYNNTVNIYQQPGESDEGLAERIERVFVRWQKQEDAVWA